MMMVRGAVQAEYEGLPIHNQKRSASNLKQQESGTFYKVSFFLLFQRETLRVNGELWHSAVRI